MLAKSEIGHDEPDGCSTHFERRVKAGQLISLKNNDKNNNHCTY
jgi:hypothetical protein